MRTPLLSLVFVAACGGDNTPPPATPSAPSASAAVAAPAASESAAPVATVTPEGPHHVDAPKEPPPPTPALVWKDMATPESVLFDAAGDRYLVSNINGKPLDADGNGYISVLNPDGTLTSKKFIESNPPKAPLNAPKGMGIAKGVLYVADIDHVRLYDAKKGTSKGAIEVKGASFLNDVAVGPDGRVFVSDSGMKQGEKDFEPAGTDAIYEIKGGKAVVVAKSTDLNRPNGLLATKEGLLVVTFGGAELYRINEHMKSTKKDPHPALKLDVTTLPNGGLDGVVSTGDSLLVSSWGGKSVYHGKLGGTFEPVLQNVTAPADIAFDTKRKRILVPRFMDGVVEAYEMK